MSEPTRDTTYHVRRARAGDDTSVAWLVERFTPLLLAQARFRLRGPLAAELPPEDLVQDVWAVALPALATLQSSGDRQTPTLVRFLATTLLYRVNNLARRVARRQRLVGAARADESTRAAEALVDRATVGVVTRVTRSEASARLVEAIERLAEADRQVVVLRGIEGHDNGKVAELIGQTPNAVSLRYRRALDKLRAALPTSADLFDELGAAGASERPPG